MIKLICPKCMKTVPVADDFAGREVTCPNCMKPFDAPARYNPAVIPDPAPALAPVPPPPPTPAALAPAPTPIAPEPRMTPDVPAPPPGFVPPAPPVTAVQLAPPPQYAAAGQTAAPTPPAGYTRSIGFTISPHVILWSPAVLLTVAFFCTFFRWIGSYLGGHPVYSQSPWQALGGWVSRNFALEASMPVSTAWLNNIPSDWLILLPYLFLLLAAAVAAWADRGLQAVDPRKVPPIAGLWPWRKPVVGVLASLAFVLVCSQILNGFGMERAIRKMVQDDPELVKLREGAAGKPADLKKVAYREETELAKYNLEKTGWQDAAVLSNLLAIVAVFLSIPLEKRGNKPPPRVVLHY
ncbi:unnamed protein product [Gemmataceae bacterium]|nr:unnamed protein product [Gemmataceae bacterium]VTU01556.1 unnamed protein product [Gemmataceae bacterium]